MVIWIEIVMFGVLPIAFAIWQIRDVRREQQRRREHKAQQEAAQRAGADDLPK